MLFFRSVQYFKIELYITILIGSTLYIKCKISKLRVLNCNIGA